MSPRDIVHPPTNDWTKVKRENDAKWWKGVVTNNRYFLSIYIDHLSRLIPIPDEAETLSFRLSLHSVLFFCRSLSTLPLATSNHPISTSIMHVYNMYIQYSTVRDYARSIYFHLGHHCTCAQHVYMYIGVLLLLLCNLAWLVWTVVYSV